MRRMRALPGVFQQQQTCQLSSLLELGANSKASTLIPHSANSKMNFRTLALSQKNMNNKMCSKIQNI
jgi:hypothetical protein